MKIAFKRNLASCTRGKRKRREAVCVIVCVLGRTSELGKAYPITSNALSWAGSIGELQNFQSYLRTKRITTYIFIRSGRQFTGTLECKETHCLRAKNSGLCLAGHKPRSAAMKAGWPWEASGCPLKGWLRLPLSSLWEGSHPVAGE